MLFFRTLPVRRSLVLALALLATSGCASALPEAPPLDCRDIPVGAGPEDMDLDFSAGRARLLVSTHDRRNWTPQGEIYAVDPQSGASHALPRRGEPPGFEFRPHGMDIRRGPDAARLYVIVHDRDVEGPWHGVAVYRIRADALDYETTLTSELLTSPNDLAVADDGSFYITNDQATRGSLIELLFRLKRANVLYYDGLGAWKIAAAELAFPNSVLIDGEHVFVSTTREDRLYRYRRAADGALGERTTVAEFKGQDNIERDGEWLYIPAHYSDLDFMRHKNNDAHPSPSVVFRAPRSGVGEARPVFVDSGARISAVATAIVWQGRLILAPVFQSKLYSCEYTP